MLIAGFLLSIVLYFVVSSEQPHWAMQIVLGIAAFGMSIVWMYLIANEVVSLMQAIGLLLGVDTGWLKKCVQMKCSNLLPYHPILLLPNPRTAILGLTVLAIGNSVGDWVADTAVARAGKPGMGVASCFGSPLLNDVLGLSISLLVIYVFVLVCNRCLCELICTLCVGM